MDYKAARRPYEFNSEAKDYHVFFQVTRKKVALSLMYSLMIQRS